MAKQDLTGKIIQIMAQRAGENSFEALYALDENGNVYFEVKISGATHWKLMIPNDKPREEAVCDSGD